MQSQKEKRDGSFQKGEEKLLEYKLKMKTNKTKQTK